MFFPLTQMNDGPCLLEYLIDLMKLEGLSRHKYLSVIFSREEGSARERVADAGGLGNMSFCKDVKMAYTVPFRPIVHVTHHRGS